MLHIDKLSEFVKERIDAQDSGVFFPQNDQYVRTSHMVRDIAQENGKNLPFLLYELGNTLTWICTRKDRTIDE